MSKTKASFRRELPPARLTREDARMLLRERDAHRAQSFLVAVVLLVWSIDLFGLLTLFPWPRALGIGALHGGLLWGLLWGGLWLLRTALDWTRWGLGWVVTQAQRGVRTWWHGVVLVVMLGGLLSGCHGVDCWVAGLHGYTCDPVYPVACTPESRSQGYCGGGGPQEVKR